MGLDEVWPYLSVEAAFEVQFKVDAHSNLDDEGEHHKGDVSGVQIWCEFSAFVFVAEKVAYYGEDGAGCLSGNVPFRTYYLWRM